MSLVTHVSMLENKHHRLDGMIEEESHRPMPDFTVIQTLKKQKLMIKEEISRLSSVERAHKTGGAA